ncbi:hypothetical protein DL764_001671 [Monosporascus ibericus]|uniref:F-box domain-containing protein n=1 Tax=Monosporascus ibericus TaxID=155417 RepID=A0A4Q4TT30_9PEZI|nr:hypothetical protein DL764_001671 [Monosporascus ibericus]
MSSEALDRLKLVSLRLAESPRLDTLPDDVLLIILSYLSTAKDISHLALASRRLHQLISVDGWRTFVRNCFQNLSLPSPVSDNDWKELAKKLTSQSRDWDRRAFVFHVFSRHERLARGRSRRNNPGHNSQTVPCHIIVDVHSQLSGRTEEETLVWGAGEDLVALARRKHDNVIRSQTWRRYGGAESGFTAGRDDVTSLSILKTPQGGTSGLLVGRASGDLRLLSMNGEKFGHTIQHYRPSPTENNAEQKEIQFFDTHEKSNLLAAATKDRILFYPLQGQEGASRADSGVGMAATEEPTPIQPNEALNIGDVRGSPSFRFIRSLRFLNGETIAVGLTSSTEPLRYLTMTPAGIESSGVPNIASHLSSDEYRLGTVRALLPINAGFIAGGGGNTILTSWDDGTIRLQDLRTPSAFDRIYQDHFEPTTPINALVSYGIERFIGGSARAPVLKIFDFRWSKGYDYTESLPCGNHAPMPPPRPPTITSEPLVAPRSRCDHLRGCLCRWHALSREIYYRPNCNVYLPKRAGSDAPVHSVAKASDVSPTLYAGLAGSLVQLTLKTSSERGFQSSENQPYSYHKAKVNIIETGDGSILSDISESQRMPIIRAQSERRSDYRFPTSITKRHRLDEWFQDPHDFSDLYL